MSAHFHRARGGLADPADQRGIARPRLGYCGVIDERLDYALIEQVADARPDWQLVLLGPDRQSGSGRHAAARQHSLSRRQALWGTSRVSGGWDVALMPFALNGATRFISPTKTPEYLAAGRPVVSTPVVDVVRQYGEMQAVRIGDTPGAFVREAERALALSTTPETWLAEADAFLAGGSWDEIWARMDGLVRQHSQARRGQASGTNGADRFRRGGLTRAYDALVIGAGFAGSVMAERLAVNGSRVLIVDRRDHVGGNAFDHLDDAGLLVHRYGPHIFHTNAKPIFRYLSRFTAWRPYEHRVRACVGDRLLPVPINRTTINAFFGLDLAERDIPAFLEAKAVAMSAVRTAEDVVLAAVGRELYEALFRDYTRKQWGVDPSRLDKSVTARVPTRITDDDRYFTDSFQAMPRNGFSRMFENMLDHPNITRLLRTDYHDIAGEFAFDHIVFTGPIDEYFGHRFGVLPYRSLRVRAPDIGAGMAPARRRRELSGLGCGLYPSDRIQAFDGAEPSSDEHLLRVSVGRRRPLLSRAMQESAALFARYQALADATPGVTFVGRLATYRYYNMDQVIGQALAAFKRLAASGLVPSGAAAGERQHRGAAE